jgi:superfamily II DNA helicase RecQ
VYVLLQEIVGDTSHVSSIKQYQRQRNGRAAFKALALHNMGNSKWDKVVEDAEAMVNTRRWDGRNSRYPLKAHVNKHCEANNDFERASQSITYMPPDQTTRVRRLLNSIQCKDASAVSAKATIQADSVKKNDFELATDFLLLMTPKPTANVREQRVSAYSTSTSTSESNSNRYYSRQEWNSMSNEEKQTILKKRKGSKIGAGTGKGAKRNKNLKAKIAALQQQVDEQTQTIASMSSKEDNVKLPPEPKVKVALKPALKPPSGFTQRS